MPAPTGERFAWDPKSEYIKRPPYFDGMPKEPAALRDITGARALAVLGDSVTTDHISPAGQHRAHRRRPRNTCSRTASTIDDFNSYGARRGNHEVMVRGTFANTRLRNALVPGVKGGVTRFLPTGEQMSIFDASETLPRSRHAADHPGRAKNTARARRAIGRRRDRCCSACAP